MNPRDGHCVACDHHGQTGLPLAEHHRILGNRDDDRPSNKLSLCGTGNVPPGCHGETHSHRKTFGNRNGYIVTRHGPRTATLEVPVYFNQPSLGRVGWYLLDDHWGLTRCDPQPGEET